MEKYHFNTNKEINNLLNNVVKKINSYANRQIEHINSLTKIGSALSQEGDLQNIFHLIFEEAINYTNADGATIYMVSEDNKYLDFKIVYNRSLNIRFGGKWGQVPWPSIPLYYDNGEKILNNMVSYVYHTKKPQTTEDVYKQDLFDISGTKTMDKNNNYRSKSMVAIPLKNHEEDILGIIQLLNSVGVTGKVQSFTQEHCAMLTSLASQAAIAMTNKKLIEGLESLLHQFVKAIAYALDKKSKYSGMHITRVALLTEMFTKVINDHKKGIFKDINYNDDEVEEISMSGWLHDIGKIITPEYIMDKSTKLESIHDRVELVEARFQLIISFIENRALSLSANETKVKDELYSTIKKLEDYLTFIKTCNIGGEFLDDDSLNTLKEIHSFRYEHKGKEYYLITDDEFEKLSIKRGTLTSAERKEMEDHAVTTKEILEQLTFPKKFKNIPLYAASHHEKLNGTGYPSHLSAEQLPLPARIIATADIFEALTAADRPYKEGKKLSAALKIMSFMVKDKHIDADLYNLLLDSGLYLEYAKQFVKPEQIDEIDIEKFKVKNLS